MVESVIAWSGKSMGRNSNWEENSFLKNVFWLIGQVRPQKFIPHPFSHSRLAPSRSRKVVELSHSRFSCCFLHFSMPKICFMCCWANGKKGTTILGFEEAVFAPVSKLGLSFTFSAVSHFSPWLGSRFVAE